MGWFGKDKDDLRKHSQESAEEKKDTEDVEDDESESDEEDNEDADEEETDDEPETPETKCAFQKDWNGDDEAWSCDLTTDDRNYCDMSKCPFWRE